MKGIWHDLVLVSAVLMTIFGTIFVAVIVMRLLGFTSSNHGAHERSDDVGIPW